MMEHWQLHGLVKLAFLELRHLLFGTLSI